MASNQIVHATKLLMGKSQFLKELSDCIAEIKSLRSLNNESPDFQLWKKRVENLLIRGFGEKTSQVEDFNWIQFYDFYADSNSRDEWSVYNCTYDSVTEFQNGLNAAQSHLLSILEDVTKHCEDNTQPVAICKLEKMGQNNKIFVVHGHDETLRIKVVHVLGKLGLEPIVLRDEPDQGRTIIEKFEENADVGFAVILLTADDKGYDKTKPEEIADRARQNVILEMGYFIGRKGRDRLMVICDSSVERPGDISGVVYTDAANETEWSFKLVKELNAAGYGVDANKLL